MRLSEHLGCYRRHASSHDFFEAGEYEKKARSHRRCLDAAARALEAIAPLGHPILADDLRAVMRHEAAEMLLAEAQGRR